MSSRAAISVVSGLFLFAAMLLLAAPGLAEEPITPATAAREVPDEQLTGRDIYQRVLDNQFQTFKQETTMSSGDSGGHLQATRIRMWFQNTRDSKNQPRSGVVVSKTLVRYLDPFDLRHTGYLVINNLSRRNDQYVYMNSSKQVRRVDLHGEAVFGTDFSEVVLTTVAVPVPLALPLGLVGLAVVAATRRRMQKVVSA